MRGAFTTDDAQELIRRRARVLCKLETLSNGTTSTADHVGGRASRDTPNLNAKQRASLKADMSTAKGRALASSSGVSGRRAMEGSLPPGTKALRDLGERVDGPPSRNDDLHGHYLWRFKAAKGDYWGSLSLCAQAERDYAREVKGNVRPANEDGPNRTKRWLTEYAGTAYWECATWEGVHPEVIKRARREGGLDPEYGVEAEQDPRTLKMLELKKNGMSQRAIAEVVGISKSEVNRILTAA